MYDNPVFHTSGDISGEDINKRLRGLNAPILLQVMENPMEGPQDPERFCQ
jgi:hypothetical protein